MAISTSVLRPLRSVVVLSGLLSTSAGLAFAQPAPARCEDNPACLSLYDQAKEQSARGNMPEALRFYRLAYEVRADPKMLFSIARVHHKLGKTEEAADYYRRFIDSPLDDPEQKRKAREYLDQLPPPPPPNVTPDPALTTGSPSAMKEEPKPVYKKWWFWTILGTVAAAGIAGGVAGGLAASQRVPEPVLRPFE